MMSETAHPAPRIAILDYGMGNLRSVHRAFIAAGANACIVRHPQEMEGQQALVFPGQGAIVDTMRLLEDLEWVPFIRQWLQADRPFFGICLGMQALFDFSEEGGTTGLGVLPGKVRRFRFALESGLKIPHMGWNQVKFTPEDAMIEEIHADSDQFYFVHSYYAVPDDPACIWGTTEYGGLEFCSAVRRGNLFATQFHPEKSQSKGLQLYRNFLKRLKSGCE